MRFVKHDYTSFGNFFRNYLSYFWIEKVVIAVNYYVCMGNLWFFSVSLSLARVDYMIFADTHGITSQKIWAPSLCLPVFLKIIKVIYSRRQREFSSMSIKSFVKITNRNWIVSGVSISYKRSCKTVTTPIHNFSFPLFADLLKERDENIQFFSV